MDKKHERSFRLFDTAADITERSATEADSVGYMSRVLIQGCWPHKEQQGREYIRQDGKYKITIYNPDGLPYGSYPRLIMAWVVTEAVLTQSKELYLGRSIREFMRRIGIDCTGGKEGTIRRLKKQAERVFNTAVFVEVTEQSGEVAHRTNDNFVIGEKVELWWSTTRSTADSLWESTIHLSDGFYKEVTERAYPLDMRVIKEIKRSPLALDVYFFLSYRMFGINRKGKSTLIPYTALHKQLGAGYPETPQGRSNFKHELLTQVTRILLLWDGLTVEKHKKGLILYPSKLAVGCRKRKS